MVKKLKHIFVYSCSLDIVESTFKQVRCNGSNFNNMIILSFNTDKYVSRFLYFIMILAFLLLLLILHSNLFLNKAHIKARAIKCFRSDSLW